MELPGLGTLELERAAGSQLVALRDTHGDRDLLKEMLWLSLSI